MQDTITDRTNGASTCPVTGGALRRIAGSEANRRWWPNQLNLKVLQQNSPLADPMGKEFNYAEEFKSLDLDAVKKDLARWEKERIDEEKAKHEETKTASEVDKELEKLDDPEAKKAAGASGGGAPKSESKK